MNDEQSEFSESEYEHVHAATRLRKKTPAEPGKFPEDWEPPDFGSGAQQRRQDNSKKKDALRRSRKVVSKGDKHRPLGLSYRERVGETGPQVDSVPLHPVPTETDGLNGYPLVLPEEKEGNPSLRNNKDPKVKAALKKIHDKLRDKAELLKLHLKHHHMNLDNFKRRTSQLQIPPDTYGMYDDEFF